MEHQDARGGVTQAITPSLGNVPTTWIIRPELLDEYYKDTLGMFWVVTICSGFNVMMAVMLLLPYSVDSQGTITGIDALSQAQSLVIWFIFSQGATIHLTLLVFSFIEMKWKRRAATHILLALISAGLIIALVYLCLSVRDGSSQPYLHKYGVPMSYIATTLGIFIIALVVRQLLNGLRIRRYWSPEADHNGLPLNNSNM